MSEPRWKRYKRKFNHKPTGTYCGGRAAQLRESRIGKIPEDQRAPVEMRIVSLSEIEVPA